MGGYADMTFLDFFWMQGKPGIFWGVELGALSPCSYCCSFSVRKNRKVDAKVETKVTDYFPTVLMLGTVLLLILASFLPEPDGGALLTLYNLRSGLICFVLCVVGVVRACIRKKGAAPVKAVLKELDTDTPAFVVWPVYGH